MAGESPDRSKQRESSAGTTSGSAGAVPEARGGVPDPRLSVARESSSRGGVDTATKVFSVREPAVDAEGPDAGKPDADEPDAAPTDATADTEEPGDAETDDRAEDAAGEDAVDGDAVDGDAADGDAAADDATDDAVDGSAAEEPAEVEDPEDDESRDGGESREEAEGAGTGGGAEGGTPDGDARLRAAVAAWVGSADGKADADAEAGAESAEAAETVDGAAESPESRAGAPRDASEGAGATADGDDAENAAQDTAEDAEDDTAEDAPQADSEPDAEPDVEPEPDAEADSEDEDEAEAEPEPDAAPPVDQPTAVFKLVRPDRPAVDQPTTTLKLGGATKTPEPAAAPEKAADKAPEKTPESEAERTSKFVALKHLDAPETRRPKPADQTAVVPQIGPERTTQQPLPPKPPLDLLAELTNTPPPPETGLRTAYRRLKIWTPLVILLAIVFAIVQAVRPLPATALTLTAEDSYTFDGDKVDLPWPKEGQGWMDVNGIGSMGDFGEQKPVAIGSVAKAMTAYIVLKDHPMKSGEEGASIPVDATAEKEGGYDKDGESTLNTVKEGDKLTQKQALSAVMIPSANNIARLLARWDAGSEAAFIKKMNATAKELGMTNTTYTDASGLKETTVSSAEDQVKLGHELVKIPALMDITKQPNWIDPSGQKWRNYNALVPYDGALGIKTGTTTKAGGNLLFAATKEVGGTTVTVVGAILGQHTAPIIDTVNAVSKTAMLAARDAMTSAKILKKGDVVGYVDDRLGHHTPVVVTKDVAAVGWAGLKVKLTFDSGDVPHTAKAGTQVGTLTVGDGSGDAVEVPVALQTDLVEPGFTDKVTRLG